MKEWLITCDFLRLFYLEMDPRPIHAAKKKIIPKTGWWLAKDTEFLNNNYLPVRNVRPHLLEMDFICLYFAAYLNPTTRLYTTYLKQYYTVRKIYEFKKIVVH